MADIRSVYPFSILGKVFSHSRGKSTQYSDNLSNSIFQIVKCCKYKPNFEGIDKQVFLDGKKFTFRRDFMLQTLID